MTGVQFFAGTEFSSLFTMSRPAPEHTHSSIQWVLWAPSPG